MNIYWVLGRQVYICIFGFLSIDDIMCDCLLYKSQKYCQNVKVETNYFNVENITILPQKFSWGPFY